VKGRNHYSEHVSICAVNYPRNVGEQIISTVLEKIQFWIEQEGYDRFIDCCCCMDSFNRNEGVLCKNGHFFCASADEESDEGCVNAMVRAQFVNIGHQDTCVLCSVCKDPFDYQKLARFLRADVWKSLEEIRVESKVNSRVEQLSHEFDKKLEDKIREFMDKYASLSSKIKLEAQRLAKQIQDDVLNLKCPHCKQPYAEFAGCMAIHCEHCNKDFCGYCHQGTETSQGAHEHVRQCLMNETNNGSYYATEEQIKVAQRKHRTRELKKFLQKCKKDVQNATIHELKADLDYHEIPQAALFEFGNLHEAMGEIQMV